MNKPIGIPGMSREREKEAQQVQVPPAPKELVVGIISDRTTGRALTLFFLSPDTSM